MFRDSNILLFLMCIFPVVLYSLIIFANSPSFSIRLKASFTYLYIGLLSITLLQFIFFIFPHIQDKLFTIEESSLEIMGEQFKIVTDTLNGLFIFAFIQIGLVEELSKWLALKCVDYFRGKRRKSLDHPYAIMFYSSLVAAAFSIVENIQYAQRVIYGEFGAVDAQDILTVRAVTSVIIHMICGLFMGYYIALGKGKSKVKKILYNIIGIGAAAITHGIYDFNLMKPNSDNDYYNVFGFFTIHISSFVIILFSTIIAFIMSYNLKNLHENKIKQQL